MCLFDVVALIAILNTDVYWLAPQLVVVVLQLLLLLTHNTATIATCPDYLSICVLLLVLQSKVGNGDGDDDDSDTADVRP